MQAIIILLVLGLSYLVGRATLRAMGVIMIGSLASLIIKPTVWGFFILMFGIGIIALLFKGILYLLGAILAVVIYLSPVIIIAILLIIIIRNYRRR